MAIPEAESTQTMDQQSYIKQADGSFAKQIVGVAGGVGQTVSLATTGNTVKIDQVAPNNQVATILNPTENVTSLTDTNTVAAPGVNGVLATVNLSVGTWDIECITYIGGTTTAVLEPTNMRLRVNAVAVSRIMNPVPGTTGGVGTGQLRVRFVVAAGTPACDIVAVAAATAGSQYSASIVAKKVA